MDNGIVLKHHPLSLEYFVSAFCDHSGCFVSIISVIRLSDILGLTGSSETGICTFDCLACLASHMWDNQVGCTFNYVPHWFRQLE